MIAEVQSNMLGLIRATFWNEQISERTVVLEEFEELEKHAITSILAPILPALYIPEDIRAA